MMLHAFCFCRKCKLNLLSNYNIKFKENILVDEATSVVISLDHHYSGVVTEKTDVKNSELAV